MPIMPNILLIEDDPIISKGLVVNLDLEGYKTYWSRDLASAYSIYDQHNIDLVILDLTLPDGDGLQFCHYSKRMVKKTPIIILTAKIDEDSVVEGLNSGASDYIRKPFGLREFLARVRAGIRSQGHQQEEIVFGNLVLLQEQRKAFFAQGEQGERRSEIKFNRREFDILSFLVQKAEMVVTREMLLDYLNNSDAIFDRTIDSHLSHIRNKLKVAGVNTLNISSIYGVGYRLEKVLPDSSKFH